MRLVPFYAKQATQQVTAQRKTRTTNNTTCINSSSTEPSCQAFSSSNTFSSSHSFNQNPPLLSTTNLKLSKMKAFTAAVALFAGAALAHPAALAARDGPCSDLLYSVAQCCSTDVLGLADLDCSTRTSCLFRGKGKRCEYNQVNANYNVASSAKDAEDHKSSCSSEGAAAHCCTIPAAGLGVLCKDV